MVYHFKQTIVVKREQEIPNYSVQRTMIRKTTLAHEVQGAYELPQQSAWKIEKYKNTHGHHAHFYFPTPPTPPQLGPPHQSQGPLDLAKGETF